MKIWFDGKRLSDERIALNVRDRGLLLGDGLFETLLVLTGKAIWRTAHLSRLAQAAQTLDIACNCARIEEAIDDLLTGESTPAEGILRITLTRGPGARGLLADGAGPASLLITLSPLPNGIFFSPVTLASVQMRRNDTAPSASMKSLSCADTIAAAREAATAGAEDGLMRNTRGTIACATIGNVFVATESGLVTPPVSDGVLPGIARSHLLAAGAREKSLPDCTTAPGLLITNSVRLARPVLGLDGRALASARNPHCLSAIETLALAVEADCGIDPRRHRACHQR